MVHKQSQEKKGPPLRRNSASIPADHRENARIPPGPAEFQRKKLRPEYRRKNIWLEYRQKSGRLFDNNQFISSKYKLIWLSNQILKVLETWFQIAFFVISTRPTSLMKNNKKMQSTINLQYTTIILLLIILSVNLAACYFTQNVC